MPIWQLEIENPKEKNLVSKILLNHEYHVKSKNIKTMNYPYAAGKEC